MGNGMERSDTVATERTRGMRGMAGGAQGSGELDKVATTSRLTIRENWEENYGNNTREQ